MRTFKFFWTTHKWTGITLSLMLVTISVTGFLLLIKKEFPWLQPPTQTGVEGTQGDYLTLEELYAVLFAHDDPRFRNESDIERIDFRPNKRVFKVHAQQEHAEIQVDAVSGEILSVDVRRSDLIESIHDGSFFAGWIHDWVMPVVPIGLMFLILSGLWLWIEPTLRKRRRRRLAFRVPEK